MAIGNELNILDQRFPTGVQMDSQGITKALREILRKKCLLKIKIFYFRTLHKSIWRFTYVKVRLKGFTNIKRLRVPVLNPI